MKDNLVDLFKCDRIGMPSRLVCIMTRSLMTLVGIRPARPAGVAHYGNDNQLEPNDGEKNDETKLNKHVRNTCVSFEWLQFELQQGESAVSDSAETLQKILILHSDSCRVQVVECLLKNSLATESFRIRSLVYFKSVGPIPPPPICVIFLQTAFYFSSNEHILLDDHTFDTNIVCCVPINRGKT